MIFPEICSDKSWKLTEIFYFYQIDTGIKLFNNKNCKVTFGFEYMYVCYSIAIPTAGHNTQSRLSRGGSEMHQPCTQRTYISTVDPIS